MGNTTGWEQIRGSVQTWTGQTNQGLVSSSNTGTLAAVTGNTGLSATAVANNVTGDVTNATTDIGIGQDMSGQAANASGGNCDDYYRMTGTGLTGNAITWPGNPNYAPGNAAVATSMFEPYGVDIHYCSGGNVTFNGGNQPVCNGGTEKDVYYVNRLPSPVPTINQAVRMAYPTPSAATGTALTANAALASVAWGYGAGNAYGLPVDGLNVQIADTSQGTCPVSVATSSVPFSTSLNSDGSRKASASAAVSGLPAANSLATCAANRINQVKYSTHRRDGLLIQSVIEFANY